ncbi:MAG: DUF697 domain-containing protein [Saprospiraceae bacterium]|nr:DUF697 domain-containing protein [Saprospiraceae bacterium]
MQENKLIESKDIIQNHVMYSMGAGMIPVPLADMVAVSGVQINMIRQLAKIYNVPFEETQTKALISALSGSIISKVGARTLIKFIPGIGSLLGGVAMGVVSGASTYALGEAFKYHFQTGGSILDFDTEKMKKFYDEQFEKGKKVAEDLKKETESKKSTDASASPSENNDIIVKLRELSDLKNAGIISETDFVEMKKKLIEKY